VGDDAFFRFAEDLAGGSSTAAYPPSRSSGSAVACSGPGRDRPALLRDYFDQRLGCEIGPTILPERLR
jgi:hypothetical protein